MPFQTKNMNNRRKIILTSGLIGGMVTIGGFFITLGLVGTKEGGYKYSEVLGYSLILLSCIPIFFGIRNIRNKVYNGQITFGRALWNGVLIALLGSVFYTLGWYIYTAVHPEIYDLMEKSYLKNLTDKGFTGQKLRDALTSFNEMMKMVKNPWVCWIFTVFMEYMPVGLLVSLISAAILRKKKKLKPEHLIDN